MRLRISRNVAFEILEREAVILHLDSGTYYTLNESATRAWELIVELSELNRIREQMLDEFDVELDRLEGDLAAMVGELREKGLVEVVET